MVPFCRTIALFAAAVLTAPLALAQCDEFAAPAAKRLIAATTVAELDEAARSMGAHPALHALYRWHRLRLAPSAAEERRYFRALPKTEEKFWCAYRLTRGELGNVHEVSEAFYGMFERAARIAYKLGIGHDRVVALALWSDGEVAEYAWDAYQWLLDHDPELTIAVLRRVPEKEQRRVCNGRLVPTPCGSPFRAAAPIRDIPSRAIGRITSACSRFTSRR